MRLSRIRARAAPPLVQAPVSIMTFDSAARTHVGRVRQVNEDRLLDRPDCRLWAIADGMGGHGGGDVAATMAIAALDRILPAERLTRACVLGAVVAGNDDIVRHNATAHGQSGATIVVLSIQDGIAELFWAGDSRAYRMRAGRCEQITRDHSVVQELVDAGLLVAADADRHPRAHVVTRALGVASAVDIERRRIDIRPGDQFLLCSDGFSRGLTAEGLAEEIRRFGNDHGEMLRRAVARDGSDNVTFVLVSAGVPGDSKATA